MRNMETCPNCGWDYDGKHCLCEWLERDELPAWKEDHERPERLKGISLAQLVAENKEGGWWYEI